MAVATPALHRVLQGLRVQGVAETDTLAEALGLDDVEVVQTLERLLDDGLVERRVGRLSGWVLTAEGEAQADGAAAGELEDEGSRAALAALADRHRRVGAKVKGAADLWDRADGGGRNDHTDERHDHKAVQALVDAHHQAAELCADLTGQLDRFEPYGTRLHRALERVLAGQGDWFTSPGIDSYLSVWRQLGDDLQATLAADGAVEETS